MKIKEQLKKFMRFYYNWERTIDITSYFILILAFVVALPSLMELQMGFIVAICALAVGLKMTFSKLRKELPALEKETKKEYIFNEKIEEQNSKIKEVERRQKKIEKKWKEQKKEK